ncbi:hypothetical protein [Methylocystis bryophila]|uniref:Uncharacterized protein n=1 Tax=Methylocystis bryophila TaxID=655015 RepID=A0A1W6MTY7_9HYPH|nr:hypothetical protein [Methylocystis bryophila]ARN81070.1 hypothetical protein B1812_08265 [Methylocystis bryophila]BDV36995.1 hypothetical protein DSM21852_02480 [Methylocystis bryophila]
MRNRIERRVLSGLNERLISADTVAEAVRAYHEEVNRLNHDRRAQNEVDRRALDKIERAISAILGAIEDGMYQPAMKARMEELETQKTEIASRMAQADPILPDVHPNVANIYRARVATFTEALSSSDGGREAAEAIRSLIGEVVLTPGEKRGQLNAELRGELMGILDLTRSPSNSTGSQITTHEAARPRNQLKAR